MISLVPHDWRFLYIGSAKSVAAISRSKAIQYQQAAGKLDLMVPREPWEIQDKEHVWRMLTDPRFYDELIPGVEWLLKYESDSMLCAMSEQSLDDWLEYDWAAAPRTPNDRFAGNGGLSIRRVSAIKKVLSFQRRENDTQPEDEWYGKRLAEGMSSKMGLRIANASESSHFSVEEVYSEKPMGFHLRDGIGHLPENVWKSKAQREKIFEYCGDIKIILPMKLTRERCLGDNGDGTIDPQAQIDEDNRKKAEEEKRLEEEREKARLAEEKKVKAQQEKEAAERERIAQRLSSSIAAQLKTEKPVATPGPAAPPEEQGGHAQPAQPSNPPGQ
jgi:hypothetical protein